MRLLQSWFITILRVAVPFQVLRCKPRAIFCRTVGQLQRVFLGRLRTLYLVRKLYWIHGGAPSNQTQNSISHLGRASRSRVRLFLDVCSRAAFLPVLILLNRTTPYPEESIAELIRVQDRLYAAGARNFLIINLPPIDRSPACKHHLMLWFSLLILVRHMLTF